MGRCAIQIVMGPAGSGKSTYCHTVQDHGATTHYQFTGGRPVHIINLDPAAEYLPYQCTTDIREELISVDQVMQELGLGPNGALLYCMEYLLENSDWLRDELDGYVDDDYVIIDCPGQVELYTHVPLMRLLVDQMRQWGYDATMVAVFCIDAAFLIDASKFLSGSLLSLTAMIAIELPHITILTKCDLMEEENVDRILEYGSATQLWELEQDNQSVLPLPTPSQANQVQDQSGNGQEQVVDQRPSREEMKHLYQIERRRRDRTRLTDAICQLLDDYQMVGFVPLNITSEESVEHVLATVHHAIQYGEDLEVRGANENPDNDDDDNDDNDDNGDNSYGQ